MPTEAEIDKATPRPWQRVPEQVYLKACHPAAPNENCSWSVSGSPVESVEYVRQDIADARVAQLAEACRAALKWIDWATDITNPEPDDSKEVIALLRAAVGEGVE